MKTQKLIEKLVKSFADCIYAANEGAVTEELAQKMAAKSISDLLQAVGEEIDSIKCRYCHDMYGQETCDCADPSVSKEAVRSRLKEIIKEVRK